MYGGKIGKAAKSNPRFFRRSHLLTFHFQVVAEMSSTVDELKEVVVQTLEKKGVLGKIRVCFLHSVAFLIALQAELRASVFTAIDEQEKHSGVYNENKTVQSILGTQDGVCFGAYLLWLIQFRKIAFTLIRELFEFCELDYTVSVLTPEASLVSCFLAIAVVSSVRLALLLTPGVAASFVCCALLRVSQPEDEIADRPARC